MYLEGFLKSPSTLQILAPQPWRVATALPPAPGPKNTFRAENFDILYDSPVEVSSFKTLSFEVKGVPHRIVIDGEGNYDPERMRRDVQKIVEASVELMGGEIPYKDYTFFLHLRADWWRWDRAPQLNLTWLWSFQFQTRDKLSQLPDAGSARVFITCGTLNVFVQTRWVLLTIQKRITRNFCGLRRALPVTTRT